MLPNASVLLYREEMSLRVAQPESDNMNENYP